MFSERSQIHDSRTFKIKGKSRKQYFLGSSFVQTGLPCQGSGKSETMGGFRNHRPVLGVHPYSGIVIPEFFQVPLPHSFGLVLGVTFSDF